MHEALYPHDPAAKSSLVLPDWSQPGAISRTAQEYEVAFGEQKLAELLERYIRDDEFTPAEYHSRILGLPWRDVFTTNWDTLLERTRPSVIQRSYGLVRTLNEIPLYPRPRIVKLHGCLSVHNRLIITEEHYRQYQTKYAPFVNTVQQAMMETTFCLIGFSGDDPNFLHWSGWVRDNLGSSAPRIYLAGWLNLSPHRRRMLEARNVTPIDLAYHPKASQWPESLKHRYATDWLISSFEVGRPNDISDWPLISKISKETIPSHLEPVQRLSSLLPKPEPWPERSAEDVGDDASAPIFEIISIWSHNRKLYPNWLVLPFRRVSQLSSVTSEWERVILTSMDRNSADRQLEIIAEILWRKSILMEPLDPKLEEAAVAALGKFDCRAECIEGDPAMEVDWNTVRTNWKTVATALLTEARHQLNGEMFSEWHEALSRYKEADGELLQRLNHEKCLWEVQELNYKGLHRVLNDWNADAAEPTWMMRKAALLFETGLNEEANRLVDTALQRIRELPKEEGSLAAESREGWALWLALSRDELLENPADAVRKWEELAIVKCNADLERNHYADAIRQDRPKTEARPFDLGVRKGKGITFSNEAYYRYLAAYRAIRLTEQAGLPPAQGGVAIASELLQLAAEAIAALEPEMAARLILRVTTYDKDKRFNAILSRTRVAVMSDETISSLSSDVLKAIEFVLPRFAARVNGTHTETWPGRLRVLMEALSRLVVRTDPGLATDVFEKALSWYSHEDISSHPWMSDAVRSLLFRSWEALPEEAKTERLPEVLSAPIVGMDGFSAFGKHYPDPGYLLMSAKLDVERTAYSREQVHDIVRFLARCMEKGAEARERASIRLSWMSHQNLLNTEEEELVVKAIWGVDYEGSEGLPKGTALYDWVFLAMPEPSPGLAEKRFREKWLTKSTEADGVEEERWGELREVGRTLRGLASRGRQLSLSEEERAYLASRVVAWSIEPAPVPIGRQTTGERIFPEAEMTEGVIEGIKAILLEINLGEDDAEKLYRKIQRLRELGIRTSKLTAGLLKHAGGRTSEVTQDLRMALASDKEELATDAMRGLWYWMQVSAEGKQGVPVPADDLVREVGVVIATRRNAALAVALQVARWIYENGHAEHKQAIAELVLEGLGFLRQELSYEKDGGPDFDVPLLRWGCVHLAIAMDREGYSSSASIVGWLESAVKDPLPEVRRAKRTNEEEQVAN